MKQSGKARVVFAGVAEFPRRGGAWLEGTQSPALSSRSTRPRSGAGSRRRARPSPPSCPRRTRRRSWPARTVTPPGHGRVQLRFRTGLAGAQYVTAQGRRDATLVRCPHHPSGGCSLARHSTYVRKMPPGTRIARWYCPESHTTFSLLPDCLAARLPGTLVEFEDAVAAVERSPSGRRGGVTRRARNRRAPCAGCGAGSGLVCRALTTVRGLLPERLADDPRLPGPPRYRCDARLAARDGRAAAPGVADAARLRPPPCNPCASQFAKPVWIFWFFS